MNKGSIVERLCSDLDRKEPRYKSPTLLFYKKFTLVAKQSILCRRQNYVLAVSPEETDRTRKSESS